MDMHASRNGINQNFMAARYRFIHRYRLLASIGRRPSDDLSRFDIPKSDYDIVLRV
jgi:hypothetical protein